MHFVYILCCRDGSLYTGWTTDLEKRLKRHNEGKGAKYTRGRIPVYLAYFEKYKDQSTALKREHKIKKMSKKQKLKLINDSNL